MKVVKVYGALKKYLGQGRFEFEVSTPAEALKAMLVNFPGLEKWLLDSEKDGVGYRVRVGKEKIGDENITDLALPWSERDTFSITPVLMGAGRGGWGQILLGAALIGASFLIPGSWAIGATATSAGLGVASTVGSIGFAMVLGGVSQLLSPTPNYDLKQRTANNIQNYSFSGIVNTSAVGTPVPIAYGRVFIGSAVISSGLDVDQLL